MRTKRCAILVYCSLLIFISLQNAFVVRAESKSVSFSFSFAWISSTFSTTIAVPDGSVPPNGTTTFDLTLTTSKMTISLEIPGYSPVSMQVDPIGESEYAIPGLKYSIPLVGDIGLILKLKGSVSGQLETEGNGTLNKDSLQWAAPGGQSIVLNATSGANVGDTINVTLSGIEYSIFAGVKAEGDILGTHYEEQIVPYLKVGSVTGTPASVSGNFKVEYPFPWSSILWGGVAVLGSACCVVGVLYLRVSRELRNVQKRATATVVPPSKPITAGLVCPSCGTGNAPGAKFCRKCGKQL